MLLLVRGFPQISKLLQPSWKMYCCPRSHFLILQDKYVDCDQQKLRDRTIKVQTVNLNVWECVLKQIWPCCCSVRPFFPFRPSTLLNTYLLPFLDGVGWGGLANWMDGCLLNSSLSMAQICQVWLNGEACSSSSVEQRGVRWRGFWGYHHHSSSPLRQCLPCEQTGHSW